MEAQQQVLSLAYDKLQVVTSGPKVDLTGITRWARIFIRWTEVAEQKRVVCTPARVLFGKQARAAALCWLALLSPSGWGAEPVVAQASVESLDRVEAEQERLRKMLEGKPKAYEDKLMDATPLAPAPELAAPGAADEGVRSVVSETRLGTAQSDSGLHLRKATELGQRVEYRRETLNYGAFLAQFDLRSSDGAAGIGSGPLGFTSEQTSGRFTLRNLGFPVKPGTFADSAVGDIASEVTEALGRAYRVSLGSSTVRGVSTRVFDAESDTRLGFGLRGTLAGGPYPGFERGQGSLAWAGHSRRFGDQLFAGLQLSRASGVPSFTFTAQPGTATVDVNSVAASVGYGNDQLAPSAHRGRLIYLHSDARGAVTSSGQGLFFEGALRSAGMRHEYGAYWAEPSLRYADTLVASDNRGAYWRLDGAGLRLNWGAGIDLEEQNPGRAASRLHRRSVNLSANAQFRIDRDRLIGGSVTLLNSRHDLPGGGAFGLGDGMRSLYATAFYQTRFRGWGRSRLRVTVRRNEVLVANDIPATGEEVEWEQAWIDGRYETMRPEFTTTLGFARDRSDGVAEARPTAGVNFRVWPAADWSVSGNLRYTSSRSNLSTSRGLSGTLDTEKALPGGWVMGASVSLNQAVVDIDQAGLGAPLVSRSNDKFASIYLRWEGTSGTGFQGAGLGAGGSVGAGSVAGLVFFDANRDGEQQSGEAGTPGVEVVMDGRYRATTDRQGRFAFPLVGTGHHQLTLTLETVPLPWGAASGQAVSIDVPLRGQANARIPVVRVGE